MNNLVSDFKGVQVYQYDLITRSSDKVAHDQRLIDSSHRLIKKNIAVNPNKCSFCVFNFEYRRYLIDSNGFKPDIKQLASLKNAPSPKNLTDLRSSVSACDN